MKKLGNSSINAYTVLTIASVLVLVLWLVMGLLVPYYFKNDFAKSGQFGDGFGAVNSLFSAIGFIALSYTIILQLQNSEKQKAQETFQLHIKLLDDLKADLDKIEMGELKGINLITYLKNKVNENDPRIGTRQFDHLFTYLTYINEQFIYLFI